MNELDSQPTDEPEPRDPTTERAWLIAFVVVLVIYAVATGWPRWWLWGFTSAHHLPPATRVIVLGGAALLGTSGFLWRVRLPAWSRAVIPIGVGVGLAVTMYAVALDVVLFGDRRIVVEDLESTTLEPGRFFLSFVQPHVQRVARELGRAWVTLGQTGFGWDVSTSFRILGAVLAGLVALAWARRILGRRGGGDVQRMGAIVTFLGAGFWLVYAGHVEDYLIPFSLLVGALLAGWRELETDRKPILATGLWLLAVRCHALMTIFGPAMVVAWVIITTRNREPATRSRRVTNVWGMFGLVGVVAFLALGGAHSSYWDHPPVRWSTTFLPITSPPTDVPERDYRVQSPDHVADVVNLVAFLAGPPTLVVLLGSLFTAVARRRSRSPADEHPATSSGAGVYLATAAVFAVGFIAVVNPRLSPQRDWDLLAVGAIPLVVWATHRLSRTVRGPGATGLATALGALVLGAPAVLVFAQPESTMQRTRELGRVALMGYHQGASYLISNAWTLERDRRRWVRMAIQDVRTTYVAGTSPDRAYLAYQLVPPAVRLGLLHEAEEMIAIGRGADPESETEALFHRSLVAAARRDLPRARELLDERARRMGGFDDRARVLLEAFQGRSQPGEGGEAPP